MKGKGSLRIAPWWGVFAFIFVLYSCAHLPYKRPPEVQTGIASWYGTKFHGQSTASKEIYDMYDLTAAHRTLPFGTKVMVTNLNNGKSVKVRINDRGPFVKGRIIDLSYAAARILGMIGPGVAPVKIEVLEEAPVYNVPQYCVQVGAFIHKKNARELRKKIRKYFSFSKVYIKVFKTPREKYYRVRIKASSLKEGQKIARKLVAKGFPALILEN